MTAQKVNPNLFAVLSLISTVLPQVLSYNGEVSKRLDKLSTDLVILENRSDAQYREVDKRLDKMFNLLLKEKRHEQDL